MHKLAHRGEKLQNPKAPQCYNYTSFFPLGKQSRAGGLGGGSYLVLCPHPPLPHSPALATSRRTDWRAGHEPPPLKKKEAVEAQQVLLILL